MVVAVLFLFLLAACKSTSENNPPPEDTNPPVYKNPDYPIEVRVEDLLSRMTLDEKIGQMTQAERQALGSIEDIKTYFLGSLLSGGGSTPSPNNAS
ncbi:MAG: hypothetical protein D6748_08125, partial [Calditrichaeota bacterium]